MSYSQTATILDLHLLSPVSAFLSASFIPIPPSERRVLSNEAFSRTFFNMANTTVYIVLYMWQGSDGHDYKCRLMDLGTWAPLKS